MNKNIIERLKTFFDSRPEIILAIIYGSYARGTETETSDVDIAAAMSEVMSLDTRLNLQLELSILLKKEIDLVDINKIKGLIHYKVFTEGFCIKKCENEGQALFHKNFMTALYWYEDYYPLYKRGQKYIIEKAFTI
ncbi:nucleotidyltransferase domain-containing protein [Treponema sp. OMZ 788]|uniref:type VII toxin-antitoxin system MntA family adenylyltransferase antitoxin n=1 Tax=Treponema sp. OMZ 788 TaxID=2563664 RepID=UPI0020A3249F|nr:nucleotidyltransferase domain-containing protein [Treponema sp. OMZ 788]UTC65417.1 nucleotidyltransferase domain-containing protein [Treponema sp. OMZ 788]